LQADLAEVTKKADADQNKAQQTQETLRQCQTELRECRAASLAAEQKFGEMRRQAESDRLKADAAQLRAA
jgi:L-lactate utilization protein LutB